MNQKIDLLVSFDTTGSMYPVLAQVRREVEQFTKTMFKEFSDLRLGIIAHGDYCDKDNPYTIRVMDFTRDEERLCKFIKETKSTFGGDADECYELVMYTAHNDLTWREDAEKIFIMIGDASPHAPSYRDNKLNLDWKEEADILRKEGIKMFSVHALAGYRSSSRAFYKYIAEATSGVYLTLDMFNEIVDLIKATCYQQGGEEKLNEFVTIIKDSGRMTRSMENNFKRLRGEEVEDTYETYRSYSSYSRTSTRRTSSDPVSIKKMDKLVPVIPGRFQIMTVDDNCAIKQFVENNGIKFKTGRGFYELSKAETVQQYKEVIMMDRETGEMFNGSQVREELGLQPQSEKGGVNERLHKDATKKFRVFVQSTSVNRKLIAGTTFLYEVDDLVDEGTVIEEVKVESTGDVTKPVKVEKKASTKKDTKKDKAEEPKAKKTTKKTKVEEPKTIAEEPKAKKKTKVEEPKAKKATKKTKVEEPKLSDIVVPDAIDKVEVDTTKTKVAKKTTKKAEPKKAEPKKAVVNVEKALDKVEAQLGKVATGVERFNTSRNKKNTEYLVNNLEKLVANATSLLDLIK